MSPSKFRVSRVTYGSFQDFNIKTGAKYFSDQLKDNNGNVVLTVGAYNGYYKGMTKADATKAAKSSCCRCQQNLD